MNQFLPNQRQTQPNPNFHQQQTFNENYTRSMDYYPNQMQPALPNQMPNAMNNQIPNPVFHSSQQQVFNPIQNQGPNFIANQSNSIQNQGSNFIPNQPNPSHNQRPNFMSNQANPVQNQGSNFIPNQPNPSHNQRPNFMSNQTNPIQNQSIMANTMRNQVPNPIGNQGSQQIYNHIPNAQPNSPRNQMFNNTPYPNQRKSPSEPAAPKENFIKKLLSKKEEPQFEYDPILGYRKLAPKAETASILKRIAEPATLDLILSNTERVLQTAQQIGPLIEQYGPMVKSIPDLISSFTSDSKESAVTKILKSTKSKKETIIEPEYEPVVDTKPDVEPLRNPSQKGPKLFV